MQKNKTYRAIPLVLGLSALVCSTAPAWLNAKSVEDKVKEGIDRASDALKNGVDECGEDLRAIQDYLNHYQWKGLVGEEVHAGPFTLSQVTYNGHPKAIVVRPGERINGHLHCFLNPDQAESMSFYRIVVGYAGKGGETTVYNRFGLSAGDSEENFTLIAPREPGLYEVRFRIVEKFTEGEALRQWVDLNGNEPDAKTTIGLIVVK